MRKYFISFIHEHEQLAMTLSHYLNDLFQGHAEFFLSVEDIRPGDDWLRLLQSRIKEAAGVMILLDKQSVIRRWINIETGAFWISGKKIFPLCFGDLRVSDLTPPLSSFQACHVFTPADVALLIRSLSQDSGIPAPPKYNASNLVETLVATYDEMHGRFLSIGRLQVAINSNSTPKIQDLTTFRITTDGLRLNFNVKPSDTMSIYGNVYDSAILSLEKNMAMKLWDHLFLEVNGTERSECDDWGHFMKLIVNGSNLPSEIKNQRLPLDNEYVRYQNGLFAFSLSDYRDDKVLQIQMLFFKIKLYDLRIRLYLS